jgi:hypothetical protein
MIIMTIKHKNTHHSTTTHLSTPENKLNIPSKKLQQQTKTKKKRPMGHIAHLSYLIYIYMV